MQGKTRIQRKLDWYKARCLLKDGELLFAVPSYKFAIAYAEGEFIFYKYNLKVKPKKSVKIIIDLNYLELIQEQEAMHLIKRIHGIVDESIHPQKY
jgi:hypothetical protein